MSYEKFNDGMVRLRQAEEDFNKALQDIQTIYNEYGKELAEKTKQARWEPWSFDNVTKETKDQELQEKDDDYYKGLKDLQEALHIIAAEDGMPASDLKDAFGTCSVCDIILGFTPEEIIDKALKWITKRNESKDEELHIGDEIEYTYPGREPEKCIVINLENGIKNEKIIWTIRLDLSQLSWFSSNCWWGDTYHKTGKHYDSIPLKKEETI